MTIVILFLVALFAALALIMMGAWAYEERTGRSGWIDATWSAAVGLVGVAAALAPVAPGGSAARAWLVAAMAAVWSARLALHIGGRNAKGGRDPRYEALKEQWGESARLRMFLFLQSQAAAGFVLVLAIFVAARHPAASLRPADALGVALFLLAVVGEAVADRQLKAFGADPANKGKVCDVGLWRLSRHPNYFFEWLGWTAYAVIAIDLTGLYPAGWLAILAPLLMYYLLVHVSGIPPLEAHMLRSRGDAFRDYQRRVIAFWPLPRIADDRAT